MKREELDINFRAISSTTSQALGQPTEVKV